MRKHTPQLLKDCPHIVVVSVSRQPSVMQYIQPHWPHPLFSRMPAYLLVHVFRARLTLMDCFWLVRITWISTIYVPESPVNVGTSHLFSAMATNSIRRVSAQRVPHILCSQNVVGWLVELWKRWPYAHYTCITQLLLIGGALENMNVVLYHVARARTLATLLDSQITA
jgi:hypothetical protein